MGFQPGQAVGDMDAVALQLLGPANVVFLIEASFQLDQHRDLRVVVTCFHQQGDHGESLPMR